MRVLLIAGGWSKEREVSLSGAIQIRDALHDLGHEVRLLDLSPDYQVLVDEARHAEAAFINLHGHPGEDGLIQALLEDVGLPYQGSGPKGSFMALNKALSKRIYSNHGLPVPRGRLYVGACIQFVPDQVPVVCKPNLGGSSLDMDIFHDPEELGKYLENLHPQEEVLLEEYIPGTEISCAVLEDTALPPILIKPRKRDFFDYQSKYDPDGAVEICPAPVSPEITEQIKKFALTAHNVLGLRHYSRTDFMLDAQDNIYTLETNTLPGMTRTSLVPKAASQAGLEFSDLISRLLFLARTSKTSRG